MEYGIQRRTIYLTPPEGDDLSYFFSEFEEEEIWQMFGFAGPSRARIMRAYRSGNLVVGIIKIAQGERRIGFAVCFPPAGNFDFWEFGYAITEKSDRDAYSALNTTDAMAHYMFEHLRVTAVGWRTREDNVTADAVVRRLGYKAFNKSFADGHNYTFYRLDQNGWAERRARLDRGEASHPSGVGATFLTLVRPFTPVVPETPKP